MNNKHFYGTYYVPIHNSKGFPYANWVSFIQNAWDQKSFRFWILKYLHIHKEMSWGWDPSLKMRFICVPYTSYTHWLKVILYTFLYASVFWLQPIPWGHEFTCFTSLLEFVISLSSYRRLSECDCWLWFQFVLKLMLMLSTSLCAYGHWWRFCLDLLFMVGEELFCFFYWLVGWLYSFWIELFW